MGHEAPPLLVTGEAQALGRLQHPNIAALFRAGATNDGIPYLAMELVDGIRLDNYTGESNPPPTEVLHLMIELARAVDAAHRRGVLHLDLKPSNILVNRDGQIKVLDFGLARLFEKGESNDTVLTHDRTLIGTLPYLAPEQVTGDSGKIDTRTDVYGLGVVLYELLCGQRPHDVSRRRPLEAVQRITTDAVVAPSARTPGLSKDLDTIVLTCLAKNPEERYPSASALADDIERFAGGFPITIKAPGALQRLRKFVVRRRALAAVLVGLLLTLAFGVITVVWSLMSARTQANAAEQTLSLLGRALTSTDPEQGAPDGPGVQRVLARIRDSLNEIQHPKLRAETEGYLGRAYLARGFAEAAQEHLQHALALRRQGVGSPTDLATSLRDMAFCYHSAKRLKDAEPLYREALAMRQNLFGHGTSQVHQVVWELAELLLASGRAKDGADLLASFVSAARRSGDVKSLAEGLTTHGEYSLRTEVPAVALRFLSEAQELRERDAGCPADARLRTKRLWAHALMATQAYQKAHSVLQSVLAEQQQLIGDSHPALTRTLESLVVVHSHLGNLQASLDARAQAAAIAAKAYGENHPRTLLLRVGLAATRARKASDKKTRSTALAQLEAVHQTLMRTQPPNSQDPVVSAIQLARLYGETGERLKQTRVLMEANKILARVNRPSLKLQADYFAAQSMAHSGEPSESVDWQRKAVSTATKISGPQSTFVLAKQAVLAARLIAANRVHTGRQLLRKVLDLAKKESSATETRMELEFAKALCSSGKREQALAVTKQVLKKCENARTPPDLLLDARELLERLRR